jgi:heme-degrading monooxygenase HmoA
MYARVTLFELDTVRLSLNEALSRFEAQVLPALRTQPGYEGVYALVTPEGKGLLLSLWQTEHDAEAGVESGYYDEQLAKFFMVLRTPPGRDHYEVIFSEVVTPSPVAAAGA